MVKTRQKILLAVLACVCALSLAALAACSSPQKSSSSSSSNDDKFASDPAEASVEQDGMSKDPFYVLVIGNDTRTGTVGIEEEMYADGNARSDTMMLVRVDPANYKLTMITVPRDTKDWAFDRIAKLNESYQEGGTTELVEHVEALTGAEIKYYLDTTFVGFQSLVNKLNGIHVNVPIAQSMTDVVTGEKMSFPAGEQDLNGAQALIFARERKKYSNINEFIDAVRQTNDRYILQTLIQKVASNPDTAVNVAKDLLADIDTNWNNDELLAYVEDFAKHADEITFYSGTGPFAGGIDPESELWLAYRDEDTWRAVIAAADDGLDPNTVLSAPSAL